MTRCDEERRGQVAASKWLPIAVAAVLDAAIAETLEHLRHVS
jgi:hypothetical protein